MDLIIIIKFTSIINSTYFLSIWFYSLQSFENGKSFQVSFFENFYFCLLICLIQAESDTCKESKNLNILSYSTKEKMFSLDFILVSLSTKLFSLACQNVCFSIVSKIQSYSEFAFSTYIHVGDAVLHLSHKPEANLAKINTADPVVNF